MAVADLRGGRLDFRVSPPNGIRIDGQYVEGDDEPRPLVGASLTGYLMDDDGSAVTSYNMTITNDVLGEFLVVFPASAFTNLWGEKISYVVSAQYSGDAGTTPLLYGTIHLQEAR